MKKFDFDVAFLGSGQANFNAALKLTKNGKSVVIIEQDKIGGTCPSYGCDPKIILDAPFSILDRAEKYQSLEIISKPDISWKNIMKYKNSLIHPLSNYLKEKFEAEGIKIIRGTGRFINENTIKVGNSKVSAQWIVIGTGQRARPLSFPGSEFTNTSNHFLELQNLPQHVVIIGAGIIAIEFASILVKLGVKVDIINENKKILPQFYSSHTGSLKNNLEENGITFYLDTTINNVSTKDNKYNVLLSTNKSIEADYILNATGRIPNIYDIGLENIGIDHNISGIVVNQNLLTSISHIFASGDVIDKKIPKLTPTAKFESNYIADYILDQSISPIKYPVIPSVIYSLPRLASVGISVDSASKEEGYVIKTIPYGKYFSAQNEFEATISIVKKADYIVGASIYGNDADNLINLFTLIIEQRVSTLDISRYILSFPSISGDILDNL